MQHNENDQTTHPMNLLNQVAAYMTKHWAEYKISVDLVYQVGPNVLQWRLTEHDTAFYSTLPDWNPNLNSHKLQWLWHQCPEQSQHLSISAVKSLNWSNRINEKSYYNYLFRFLDYFALNFLNFLEFLWYYYSITFSWTAVIHWIATI